MNPNYMFDPILAIVVPVMLICVSSLLSIVVWSNARRREREAFYRGETMKKVADSGGAGATTVLEMLREEERAARKRRREWQTFCGLITIASGAGIMVLMRALERREPVYLAGLIPIFVGVAMLAYVFLLAERD